MTSNSNHEAAAAELVKQIEAEQSEAPSLQSIELMGKQILAQRLAEVNVLKDTITYSGFVKALRLALTHEVAPEMSKQELIPKQQLVAAVLAKVLDVVINLKLAQLAAQEQQKGESVNDDKEQQNSSNV